MAKRVYFAFHYQDVCDFRANVVSNHWMTNPHREAAGFFDASLWEDAKLRLPLLPFAILGTCRVGGRTASMSPRADGAARESG